jgi:ribosomal protein S7
MIKKLKLISALIINNIIVKGKKQVSEKILKQIIKQLQRQFSTNHVSLIKFILIKTAPIIKIKTIKQTKKRVKEFPFIVKASTRNSKAIKEVIKTTSNRSKKKFIENFIGEFSTVLSHENKNKHILHEYAFTTKKFAHFRWF